MPKKKIRKVYETLLEGETANALAFAPRPPANVSYAPLCWRSAIRTLRIAMFST